MNDYPWRIQIIYGFILSLVLFWILLPISIGICLLASIIALAIAGGLLYRLHKQRKILATSTQDIDFLAKKLALLPARQRYRLPILLVTGNTAKSLFPDNLALAESNVVISSDAAWIYVEEYQQLPIVFDSLVARWPDMLGRIGLFLSVAPEQESKSGLFSAKLQSFRQSWDDTCRLAKYRLPVYVTAHIGLNNLHYHDDAALIVYWYQMINNELYLLDEFSSPINNWANDKIITSKERQQRLSLRAMLTEYEKWVKTQIIDVLEDSKQPINQCTPTGIAIYPLNGLKVEDNLVNMAFIKLTTLPIPNDYLLPQEAITPPDKLVKFMPIAYPFAPISKMICGLVIISSLFIAGSLGASFWNNLKLAKQIKNDIHHYNLIAMDSYEEKLQALNIIKADRDLLNEYLKKGEPFRLSFGLYQGQKLIDPLSEAIATYIAKPPPIKIKEVIIEKPAEIIIKKPETIRLDSLSLFESGKAQLKPESTKILINALMAIKSHIEINKDVGWLVLISGHTDSTGDPSKNQQLSLARAAAVRDWLVESSDIPASCFATVGYGASSPLVSNDTPEDRAKNRRVEINLMPQQDELGKTCKFVENN